MLKLRTILLLNYPYYIILVLVILISSIRLTIPKTSKYSIASTECSGKVIAYELVDKTLKLTIKNKEQVIIYYYLKEDNDYKNINLGDTVFVTGEFSKPKKNTTDNLFNYEKYLYNKNTFYLVNATTITITKENSNLYYKIKQFIKEKTSINPYLQAFILGDKSLINKNVVTSYQENGISHLFAISGMHITLLSSILLNILKKLKIKEEKRYLFTSLFLVFYLSLIGLSPSALRGVLFFILFSINKVYYFYIKPQNIFILVLSLTLLIDPFYVYDIGFQYSFVISLTLILMSHTITGNYLLKLLKTSLLAFIISLPISLMNYYQINLLSILYNLFYVPLVSYIIFPLSLLTFLIKPLLPIYKVFIFILEQTSLFFNKITLGKLIFPKLNNIIYIVYFIIIIIIFINYKKPKKPVLVFILILLFHFNYPTFKNKSFIKIIDVGQGDSILLHSKNESILVDTGGTTAYTSSEESKIATMTTIPLLKSLGIRKLKYLILTHGDADHMQEAKYLLDNFKVENVLINLGEINYLEEEIIKLFPETKIGEEGLILTCGDINLIQLNTDLSEENDSSQIYYVKYNDTTLLLTGDASQKSEEYILNNYELGNIDILKVGHHGSKTSTGTKLLQTIKPKLALISCGIDNKFGHPHESVLTSLEKYNVNYLTTAKEGTITIDLNTLEVN